MSDMESDKHLIQVEKVKLPGSAPDGEFSILNSFSQNKTDAVFPIISKNNNGEVTVLGTGFFISRTGIFVTARHVFENMPEDEIIYLIQLVGAKEIIERPIITKWMSLKSDICIGLAAPMQDDSGNHLLNTRCRLSTKKPVINDSVYTYSFPKSEAENSYDASIIKFNPDFFKGEILQLYPDGRDKTMNWPCYETNIHIYAGSSGGPVFNENDNVIGVNCSSIEPYVDASFITGVRDIIRGCVHYIDPSTNIARDIPILELDKQWFTHIVDI